jgi:DmsE family decaheme c-type cytochrome
MNYRSSLLHKALQAYAARAGKSRPASAGDKRRDMLGSIASIAAAAIAAVWLMASPAPAAAQAPGPEVCKSCHEATHNSYAGSVHGQKGNKRGPAGAGECATCHGDGTEHVKAGGGRGVGGIFNPGSKTASTDKKNEVCLSCHKRDSKRSHWEGSTHQTRGVACASCHSMHAPRDKVLTKVTQPEVCFACHKQQRVEINRPSRHPILEGKVSCSDCHNVHGSVGPKLVKRDSTVETCYQCHMEKRGPFVHNHEPVQEDCSNCHNPHGTVVESMLKARPPFLCHQCHTPHGGNVAQLAGQGQTSAAFGPLLSATTGGKSGINYTQGRGCVNCHTQVHGSNNPSATNPTPQFMLR